MVRSIKRWGFRAAQMRVRVLFLAMLAGIAGLSYTACDASLGLGDPVDTVAPLITILSPRDDEFMRGIAIGEPIQLTGYCYDDFGVSELKVKVTNVITGVTFSPKFTYSFDSKETWRAYLYLPGDGFAEYRIRISALDKYKNEGADEVRVRVDLVAPWVREATIIRHDKFYSELKNIKSYEDLSFRTNNMYKEIQYTNIDDFQNEAFTVSLIIDFNLDHVAASRLDVYGENGVKLNTLPLIPTNEPTKETPEWRITRDELTGWHLRYGQGAQYIYFVAMAWNTNSWDPGGTGFNGGGTRPGESNREQRIDGTCWYPESDYPHIDPVNSVSDGFVTLTPSTQNALSLQFFDDDKLAEIYAAIIPKEKMDELRGTMSEAAYLELLATDNIKRNAVITGLTLANLYNSGASPDGRYQAVNLGSGTAGEYRLLALVRDDKSAPLDTLSGSLWTVHPPLRVQVQDPDDPLIMVESPALENSFPTLTSGRKFSISGFAVDNVGVDAIQIAWIPAGSPITVAQAQQALRDVVLSEGSSTVLANQMKIWRLTKGARSTMTLNGINYIRDNFSQEFDILDDFRYNSQTQNDNKLFIIHAIKGARNIYKSFNLTGNTEKPVIRLIYPYRDMLVHDTEQNLTLSMEVSSNIGLKNESIKIKDKTAGAPNEDYGMGTMTSSGAVYQRTIPASFIANNFPEGSRRTYWFEAEDILGNSQLVERTIIMSNLPALQYITSSNAPGVYGIGTELRFEAVFSLPIKILTQGGTGPRLKLYFKDPGAGDPGIPGIPSNPNKDGVYAKYVTVAGNTIVFSYVIKEGDLAPLLYNPLNPIDLNSSTIETTEAGGGYATTVLQSGNGVQNRVAIEVDGIRPKIDGAGFTQPVTGEPYYNNGKTVTLELYASKRVRVSGTPTASINYGTGTATASFSKITHDGLTSTLYFTYMVDVGNNVQQSQLAWAASWIQFTGTDSITDMAGNALDLGTASLPTGNALNGTNLIPPKPAYIITRSPNAPTFTLYRNLVGSTPTTTLVNELANNDIYIVIDRNGASGTDLLYSLEAGNNPKTYSGTPNYETIPDTDKANRDKVSYIPSEYKIIAWQTDKAGNRSSNSAERSIVINSRAPELVDITCIEPNGSYSSGKILNFKLVFSRKVRLQPLAPASANLTLTGTASAPYNGTVTIDLTTASNTPFDSSLLFTWQIPPGLQMNNIKATNIVLDGVYDEYGNQLKPYTSVVSTENTTQRPISTAPNLVREGLIVDSKVPKIDVYNPAKPGAGELSNGGLMDKAPETSGLNKGMVTDATIILTFDKPVLAQSGKNITIRPWNNWAIPPILTVDEMDGLQNSPVLSTDQKRMLKWIDANGLPERGGRTTEVAFNERTKYNSYIFTTHGLNTEGAGEVRPDTSPKWVLAFDRDLYTGTSAGQLREVFNTAHWKWQIISATSGSVSISNNVVTITLPEPLQKGRIWEVLMDSGTFRDAAGNESEAITTTASAGQGYRFWTKGTADPVIRVDKHSHGDSYHSHPASYRGDWSERPFIDTKLRIDCETPGATIRYDTIRTKYTLSAGGAAGTSNAFSGTDQTVAFFNHSNVAAGGINAIPSNTNYTNHRIGFSNNVIGNSGSHHGGALALPGMQDGYFTGLLVPNTDQTNSTSAANMVTQNGAVKKSEMAAKGASLINGANLSTSISSLAYRTINSNGSAAALDGIHVFNVSSRPSSSPESALGDFFYAGDAYRTNGAAIENDRNAASDTDEKLFTGRRDYVASAAQKNAVTSAVESAGPALGVSNATYEGVFKTTVLYREPGVGLYWVTIQGFDTPMTTSTPGFPLQEYIAGPDTLAEHLYFSRQAWRVGAVGTLARTTIGTWPTGTVTNTVLQTSNNHIWVSWDIVSDWYIKGRNKGTGGNIGRLQRSGHNYGAVLATYGAVTYRYRQHFDNNTGLNGTASVTNPGITQ